MVKLPSDKNFALRGQILQEAIEKDKAEGRIPFFVCNIFSLISIKIAARNSFILQLKTCQLVAMQASYHIKITEEYHYF